MKQLIVTLTFMALMGLSSGQCINCNDGTFLLSPLSYTTMRSHEFNRTRPSNEGCTNGVSVDGKVAIDCGQGTTLIDCNRGYNDNADYSDLSKYFIWNKTASVDQRVSIVFRFDQQINISRIIMFFWNSQSNSIIVPNVIMYWSNDDSIMPRNVIDTTPGSPNRNGDRRGRLNVDNNNTGLQFQYLRIDMSFYDNSEWIFLSEVQFCGNAAPYHITQPSTDNYVQIPSSTATMATLTCSLNVTIPTDMIITWSHNGSVVTTITPDETTDGTTTLTIENPQLSDDGVYLCTFNDVASSGWVLERNIILLITVPQIIQPPVDYHTVAFDESTSSVQLMCSLNIDIPSSVTVTWLLSNNHAMTAPPNGVITAGNTTTLIIGNPQPSDAGAYGCSFSELNLLRFISLVYTGTSTGTPATSVTTTATAETIAATAAMTATPAIITDTVVVTDATFTPSATTSGTSAPTNGTGTTSETSDDDSSDVGAIVAVVVVVILLIAIVVTVLIIIYFWRRKQKAYRVYDNDAELNEQPSSYMNVPSPSTKEDVDGTPSTENMYYNQKPSSVYAVPTKRERKEKRKSAELQKRMSIEFNYKPQRSPEMSVRSRKQTLSLISSDNDQTVEFDIYGTAPKIPERTEASNCMVYDEEVTEENPIYSETINPASIVTTSSSQDYSSIDDNLCPYSSIYAEPLPLVKSEGPPTVNSRNIKPLHQLGVGQFGEVILAETVGLSYQYLGIGNSNDKTVSMKVAVKTLKSSPSADIRKSFEKEIKFMSRLKDDNVIRLLGICTTGTPFIMMEYMENGDLNQYLQRFKFMYETDRLPAANEITLNALVYMSYQVASGMKYLSSCNFIHRDLAARNILVGVDYTVKIADFGMSQNLYSAYYCKVSGQNVLPIRWMAFECFYGKFSVQSDIWAFGITLWEIFALCKDRPFEDLSDQQVIDDAIKGANRQIPEQPPICPDDIYYIMKSCWRHEPSERAKFNVLSDQLNECYSNIL